MAEEKSYITAFCRPCQAPRYRSIRPLSRTDQTKPELFKALDPEAPAPTEGRAACYLCQDTLVLMADTKLPPIKTEPVRHQVNPAELTAPPELFQKEPDTPLPPVPVLAPAPIADLTVETLFELTPGEELKFFQDSTTSVFIVTNKRIVRVRKG